MLVMHGTIWQAWFDPVRLDWMRFDTAGTVGCDGIGQGLL